MSIQNQNQNKKKLKQDFTQSTEEAQIDILINECISELSDYELKKKQIIIKYADEIARITNHPEDVGIELLSGLRRKGYRMDKSWIYKTFKAEGRNYCRGFEKHTVESGDIPETTAYNDTSKSDPLTVRATPLSDADYNISLLVDKLKEQIKGLTEEKQELLQKIDKMRQNTGLKWFEVSTGFLEKRFNDAMRKNLDKVWFVTEGDYCVTILDREPKTVDDCYNAMTEE